MKADLLAFVLGLFCGSPNSELLAATADIVRLPAADQPYTRYLTSYALADQSSVPAVLKFWVNSLSTRKRFAFPALVSNGVRADFVLRPGTLYRLDIREYGWLADAWEQLSKEDPYFGSAWLDPQADLALRTYTQSRSPVLRADWFVARTSIEPHYSRFLGLGKTVDEVKRQFAVQEDDVRRLYINAQGATLQSIVALHNRQLERLPTITGYWWQSRDTKSNVGRANVIAGGENLFAIKPDGQEYIWSLGNGLQGYFLSDGAGKQVAEVPPDIAQDSVTAFADKRVVNARSCVGCHDAGLRPFTDTIAGLIRGSRVKLADPNKDQVLRLEELYLTDLADRLARDQERYAAAVKAVNGLTTQANAAAFETMVHRYFEGRIDLATACREVGITEAQAANVFGRSFDGTLTVLMAGQTVARDSWEASFKEAMVLAQGLHK